MVDKEAMVVDTVAKVGTGEEVMEDMDMAKEDMVEAMVAKVVMAVEVIIKEAILMEVVLDKMAHA